MEEKLMLKSSRIFDSEERCFFPGAIIVEGGRIAALYRGEEACRRLQTEEFHLIDVGNLVISPGFIDIHCHEDEFDCTAACPVAEDMARMGVTTCVAGNCGTMFQPLENFLNHAEKFGTPVNYVFFTGYNEERLAQGNDIYGPCRGERLQSLVRALKRDLERGAVGISFGLEYAPGIDREEILTAVKALDREELAISVHIRDDKEKSLAAVEEAIEIGRMTGKKVFISHIGSMAAYGQMERVYGLMDRARAEGISIYVDCYPYNAFATTIGSAVFDEQSMAEGKFSYEQILFATGPLAGKRCTEELYRKARSQFPDDFAIGFGMDEEEIRWALARPETMVGSDGFVLGDEGHPRTAGSFPRVLGRYVRQEGLLSLADALAKMTIMPTQALGLTRKGKIAPGLDADLVIFDPETIIDQADFTRVNEPPEGIAAVFVNGKLAVSEKTVRGRYGEFIPVTDFAPRKEGE